MYFTDLSALEDPLDYDSINVGDKTFYYKKEKEAEHRPSRRRYSDQFKDPLFKAKDAHRKLNMLKQLTEKQGLDELTDKYRNAIMECVWILKQEGGIEPASVYKHFNMGNFGFNPEDFGVAENEE